MDWLGGQLRINRPEDWYKVKKLSGGILTRYNNSLYAALSNIYPEYPWLPWLFGTVATGFWNDKKNLTNFFEWFANTTGITGPEDWYNVRESELKKHGGIALIFRYQTLEKALQHVYSHKSEWPIQAPKSTEPGYWDDRQHQLNFMNRVQRDLKIKQLDDWYNVKRADLTKKGGALVVSKYGNSLVRCLMSLYPDHPWQPWKFETVPRTLWEDVDTQRRYFDWLFKELNLKDKEEWYNVKEETVRSKGGNSLMSYHKNSLAKALVTAYPDYPWQAWRFGNVPVSMWDEPERGREFVVWAGKTLGVKELNDWYEIRNEEVRKLGGAYLLQRNGGLLGLLSRYYPEKKWELGKFIAFRNPFGMQPEQPTPIPSPNMRGREFVVWAGKTLG